MSKAGPIAGRTRAIVPKVFYTGLSRLAHAAIVIAAGIHRILAGKTTSATLPADYIHLEQIRKPAEVTKFLYTNLYDKDAWG